MNSKTYARTALLRPFAVLLESLGFFLLPRSQSDPLTPLGQVNLFWDFAAVFWCLPYAFLIEVYKGWV